MDETRPYAALFRAFRLELGATSTPGRQGRQSGSDVPGKKTAREKTLGLLKCFRWRALRQAAKEWLMLTRTVSTCLELALGTRRFRRAELVESTRVCTRRFLGRGPCLFPSGRPI